MSVNFKIICEKSQILLVIFSPSNFVVVNFLFLFGGFNCWGNMRNSLDIGHNLHDMHRMCRNVHVVKSFSINQHHIALYKTLCIDHTLEFLSSAAAKARDGRY